MDLPFFHHNMVFDFEQGDFVLLPLFYLSLDNPFAYGDPLLAFVDSIFLPLWDAAFGVQLDNLSDAVLVAPVPFHKSLYTFPAAFPLDIAWAVVFEGVAFGLEVFEREVFLFPPFYPLAWVLLFSSHT
jgi:hypothetical protein